MRVPHLLSAALLWMMLLFIAGCYSPKSAPVGSSDVAYFGRADLERLLATTGCTALRFYPAIRARGDAVSTALVIPVDKDGDELYSFVLGPWYHLYDRMDGGGPVMKKLIKSDAKSQVMDVRELGREPFAADFKKARVEELLALDKANGLRVDLSVSSEGKPTFHMFTVSFGPTGPTVLGDGSYTQHCDQPCPNLCPGHYLHR